MADLAAQLRALADRVADLDPAELVGQLEALRAHALAAALAPMAGADDCECLDAEAVAQRLACSVDLVRQRGEEWGIAKVLARDARGRPTRVVYPLARLRAYLAPEAGEEHDLLDRSTPLRVGDSACSGRRGRRTT
jgi:hypothetical protein